MASKLAKKLYDIEPIFDETRLHEAAMQLTVATIGACIGLHMETQYIYGAYNNQPGSIVVAKKS